MSLFMLHMPSNGVRTGRIHDVATSTNRCARNVNPSSRVPGQQRVRPSRHGVDSRFGVQVHQSLPFMDFSTAKWEMLLGVRNFFREASSDQSVYDELLVVHPPKRIVGGLTMRF
jgi:hypothetical protein